MPPTTKDRFWAKVNKTDGCWFWMGRKNGRPRVKVDGIRKYVYVLAYELARGPMPEGLEPDHLCRVPACVNPDHLEAVTHKENIRRAFPIPAHNEEAHLVKKHKRGNHCRACSAIYRRAWRERRREADSRRSEPSTAAVTAEVASVATPAPDARMGVASAKARAAR